VAGGPPTTTDFFQVRTDDAAIAGASATGRESRLRAWRCIFRLMMAGYY